METSLHRQLKELYAGEAAQTEVRLGDYRIDAVLDGRLIEIQHASLAAIRDKLRALLKSHRVLVVKPIVAVKHLVKRARKNGRVVDRRKSPKHGTRLDVFEELVYLTRLFPHPKLTLEMVLVEVEEWRYPGHGRRRWRRSTDYLVEDQKLVALRGVLRFHSAGDLMQIIPDELPSPFHTGHLAESLNIQRWVAQRIAYCLRETGAVEQVGKQGNAWLYQCCA